MESVLWLAFIIISSFNVSQGIGVMKNVSLTVQKQSVEFTTTFEVQKDTVLVNGLLLELKLCGFAQCMKQCLLHSSCVGLVHDGLICRLGKDLSGFSIVTNSSLDSVYIPTSSIPLSLYIPLLGSCFLNTCQSGSKCQTFTDIPKRCIVTDCQSIQNTDIQVGSLLVGSNTRFNCTNGEQLIGLDTQKCMADGQWFPGNILCGCDEDNGYVELSTGCYKPYFLRQNAEEAKNTCGDDGGYLAKIDTLDKYDDMVEIAGSSGLFYIEGTLAIFNIWRFEDGSQVPDFNWIQSSYSGQCRAYYPAQNGITEMNCDYGHYFLCELR